MDKKPLAHWYVLFLSLKLFQHLDLFRILVCGGDGSIGWVMTEIDKMNLIKKVRKSNQPVQRIGLMLNSCTPTPHLVKAPYTAN